MMMRAGLKLCGRNPTHTPTAMIATSGPKFGEASSPRSLELLGVEEERPGGDGDDPGGETVEAVDEVDRLRHPEQPQHGDERSPVGRQQDVVDERDAEVVHRHAVLHEDETGEDDRRHLGRRQRAADVVVQPDGEDDRPPRR